MSATCDRCNQPESLHTGLEMFCPFYSTFRAAPAAAPGAAAPATEESDYELLRDTIHEHLAAFVRPDDVAEVAIYCEAVERAAAALGAPGRAAPEPPEDHASFEEARAAGFPALRRSLEKRRRADHEGVSSPEPTDAKPFERAVEDLDNWMIQNTPPGFPRTRYFDLMRRIIAAHHYAPASGPEQGAAGASDAALEAATAWLNQRGGQVHAGEVREFVALIRSAAREPATQPADSQPLSEREKPANRGGLSQTETFEWLRLRSNRLAALEQAVIDANGHSHRDAPGWNQIIPMSHYKAICDLVEVPDAR